MSLVKFPPSNMASPSFSSETSPLLGSTSTDRVHRLVQKASHLNKATPSPRLSVFPLVCVIAAVMLERITYYGVLANLILFLNSDITFTTNQTITVVLIFTGMAWFMSTVGGFIGDAYSGRHNAIWGSMLIYIVGASWLPALAYFSEEGKRKRLFHNSVFQVLTCLSLLVISVGEGAYKANISAFGAEQLERHDDDIYRRYFNWYYWSINLGSFIAYSAIAYLQLRVSYFVGFLVPLGCIFMATCVFCCGRSYYIVHPPTGNFKNVYNIIKEARNRKNQNASRYSVYVGVGVGVEVVQ